MVKVAFPLTIRDTVATFEVPYGGITRSALMRNSIDSAKIEVPPLRWVDLSADGYGVTLLSRAKYGHDVKGNVLRLSLLRSPTWPDPTADRGKHVIEYALYPHAGTWREAESPRRAIEYNAPLLTVETGRHSGTIRARTSFLRLEPASLVLSSVKRAEDGDGWVLQWYDALGTGGDSADEDEIGPTDNDTAEDEPAGQTPVEPKWEWRHARRRGGGAESSSYSEKRPHQFYPIYIDETARRVIRVGESIPLEQEPDFKKVGGLRPLWPIDTQGRHRCWSFVPSSMQPMIEQGHVALGKYHPERDDWTVNYRVPVKSTRKLKTVWWEKAHDAGTHGTELLKRLPANPYILVWCVYSPWCVDIQSRCQRGYLRIGLWLR